MANAVVSQSGGPTGVINASLVGVIAEACKHKEIDNIYGGVHAVAGIVEEKFVDLRQLSVKTLETVSFSPSSALGSSRDKPDTEYCQRVLDVFKKHDIKYFYYIGGNDSANTCYLINEMAMKTGYNFKAFHVPKTVDNDLLVTDHCPGFGTAGKFVACALMGDDLDNRALPGVKVDVIMGRHAGFLTGAAALAKQREDDGPHLIYIPERAVSMDKFLGDIEAVYSKLGRCVVAVSEGMMADERILPGRKSWLKMPNATPTETCSFPVRALSLISCPAKSRVTLKSNAFVRTPLVICSAALRDCSQKRIMKKLSNAAAKQ
jgi:6-phosphofructokinase 1